MVIYCLLFQCLCFQVAVKATADPNITARFLQQNLNFNLHQFMTSAAISLTWPNKDLMKGVWRQHKSLDLRLESKNVISDLNNNSSTKQANSSCVLIKLRKVQWTSGAGSLRYSCDIMWYCRRAAEMPQWSLWRCHSKTVSETPSKTEAAVHSCHEMCKSVFRFAGHSMQTNVCLVPWDRTVSIQ